MHTNEFVDLAFELVAECSPNETRFPRHLVLGKVKMMGFVLKTHCHADQVCIERILFKRQFIILKKKN